MSGFWKVLISIVATFVIVGGGIFYLMEKQIDSVRSNDQTKMDDLNKQIAGLKSTTSTSTTTGTPSTATTVDVTADWKTYSNAKYGFSFKYPKDCAVASQGMVADDADSPQQLVFCTINGAETDIFDISLMILADYKSSDTNNVLSLSVKEFAQKYVDATKNNLYVKDNKTGDLLKTTVAGVDAYQFTTTTLFDGPFGGGVTSRLENHVFVARNSDKAVITYPVGNQNSLLILSTVQFIPVK